MPPHYLIIKVLLLTVALRIVSATHSPVSETRRNFPESDEVTVGRFVGFQVFVLSDSSVMVGTPLSSTVTRNCLVLLAVEDFRSMLSGALNVKKSPFVSFREIAFELTYRTSPVR